VEGCARIELAHLPHCEGPTRAAVRAPTDRGAVSGWGATFAGATRAFQRAYLCEQLERSHWNMTRAARACDISRSQLYERLKEHGLRRPGDDEPAV
jgi:transcriptional regulator of acetoin/glycerol metabolism